MAKSPNKPCNNVNTSPPPPWQVLFLVAHHLDPKTLAMASCVSKSWSSCFSLDHHWKSICNTHYPSLSTLKTTHPQVSYNRLYALGHTAAKRRFGNPPKPHLSLQNLVFSIDVRTKSSNITVAALAICGEDLVCGPNGLFQFDIDIVGHGSCRPVPVQDGVKIAWNVVLKGWRGVFCMMDCEGKGGLVPGGWFSEELPPPGCCSKEIASGLVADLRLSFGGGGGIGMVRAERVSVGLLGVGSWRYVTIDDALRYLQHFLVPDSRNV